MKYIKKGASPRMYSQWCTAVASTDKANWREVPAPEKQAVLAALLAEQGALCAYTMRRIENASAHVEHIKPQHLCRVDRAGSDLDYGNLVACYPREGMRPMERYGAPQKGGWWEKGGADFVSPLRPECESRFHFGLDGRVVAVRNGRAAVTTIQVLALNHESLIEDRKHVIEEVVYGPRGNEPLSRAKADRVRQSICKRQGDHAFYPFCVAIRGALEDHLVRLTKLARRRRAVRKRG